MRSGIIKCNEGDQPPKSSYLPSEEREREECKCIPPYGLVACVYVLLIHTVYDSLIEIHIYTRCDVIVLVLPADLRICQYHDKERGHALTKHHQMLLKYHSKYAHRVVSSTSQIFMLYVPLSVFAPTHRCKIVRRACAKGKQVSRPHGNK